MINKKLSITNHLMCILGAAILISPVSIASPNEACFEACNKALAKCIEKCAENVPGNDDCKEECKAAMDACRKNCGTDLE